MDQAVTTMPIETVGRNELGRVANFPADYRSTFQRGRIDSPLAMLRDIVAESRVRNEREGVTGFMMFDGTSFIQALEGAEDNVMATYSRIARDPRHRDVTILATRIIGSRDFPDWSMEGWLGQRREKEILKRYGVMDGDIGAVQTSNVIALIREIAFAAR